MEKLNLETALTLLLLSPQRLKTSSLSSRAEVLTEKGLRVKIAALNSTGTQNGYRKTTLQGLHASVQLHTARLYLSDGYKWSFVPTHGYKFNESTSAVASQKSARTRQIGRMQDTAVLVLLILFERRSQAAVTAVVKVYNGPLKGKHVHHSRHFRFIPTSQLAILPIRMHAIQVLAASLAILPSVFAQSATPATSPTLFNGFYVITSAGDGTVLSLNSQQGVFSLRYANSHFRSHSTIVRGKAHIRLCKSC